MKRSFIILFSTIVTLSCSLEEQLTSDTPRDAFYNNAIECESGLNACYNLLRTQLSNSGFWAATECTTDLMYNNTSSNYNATLNISPSRPAIASTIWKYSYMGVMRSNELIHAIDAANEKGNIGDEKALELTAEAIVLRAFFYYLLTSTFGDVPFYTVPVTEDNMDSISRLPRMSADDTRDYLIDELMEYLMPNASDGREALPLKRSYDAPVTNRMNAAVGLMLAGKFCLWNERWEDAVAVLGVLEDIYGHYAAAPESFAAAYPLTDIPFGKKLTKESILELENSFEPYGVQQTGLLAMYATPSKNTTEIENETDDEVYLITDIYNGIVIPELGENARISTSARPTKYYYQTVLSYDSPDLRSGEYSNDAETPRGGSGNLAWRWSGYDTDDVDRLPENRNVKWFSACTKPINRPWLGNKFWCENMYYNMDSNNYKIFRFADALLMLAEAHLMNGDIEKAAGYLNITRTRAGLEAFTPSSIGFNAQILMEEIRLERARELFGEFQRKYDLVRWGIWYERTTQYNDGTYINDYIRPYHEYLPIPQEQITYSHGALDNKAYGEN